MPRVVPGNSSHWLTVVVPASPAGLCPNLPRLLAGSLLRQTLLPDEVIIGVSIAKTMHHHLHRDTNDCLRRNQDGARCHMQLRDASCLHAGRNLANSKQVRLRWHVGLAAPSAASSRNGALSLVNPSSMVAFHDDDDFVHPQWLEFAMYVLRSQPDASAVVANYLNPQALQVKLDYRMCGGGTGSPWCRRHDFDQVPLSKSTDILASRLHNIHSSSTYGAGTIRTSGSFRTACRKLTSPPFAKPVLPCGAIHQAFAVFRRKPTHTFFYDGGRRGQDGQFNFDALKQGALFVFADFASVCYKCGDIFSPLYATLTGPAESAVFEHENNATTCGCSTTPGLHKASLNARDRGSRHRMKRMKWL